MSGASTTVDGITDRPVYAYEPPQAFFEAPSDTQPLSGPDIFLASAYGAVADPTIDNRSAIQAAIDAAHDAGGGVVVLDAGIYGVAGTADDVGAIQLKDNVFLKGAGMGETSLRVVDGWDGTLTGIVRTPWGEATVNYGLADLTLDGNRDNTTGKIDAFFSGGIPGATVTDEDAWIVRVEAQNNSGYGFDPHERTARLTITKSVAHDNGLDGFVADFVIDGVYSNNLAYDNDRHGFNIVTTSNDLLLSNNVARDNGGAGIVVQRGSENIPSPENIVIEGGELYGNGREGVLIQLSQNIEVRDVNIHDNGTYGVRIMGSSDISVVDNIIADNSRSSDGSYAGVQIRDDDDLDVSGGVFGAENNLIAGNEIGWSDGLSGSYGIEERAGSVAGNVIQSNDIDGALRAIFRLGGPDTTVTHSGDNGDDAFSGGGGDDVLAGGGGADTIAGGTGDDWISGDTNRDTIAGDDGRDTLYGRDGDDTISGGSGDDWISGGKGVDVVSGGDGADEIYGNTGNDDISGGAGDDALRGNDGDDIVFGEAGSDWISGGKGLDALHGGEGDDTVNGDSNFDSLFGEAGNDVLSGGSGNDRLFGGEGSDRLSGGSGTDTLTGGAGNDTLTGNDGYDDFVLEVGGGVDTVTDFTAGQDDLDLKAFGFVNFDAVVTRVAKDGNDTFIDLGNGDGIVLLDFDPSALNANDTIL